LDSERLDDFVLVVDRIVSEDAPRLFDEHWIRARYAPLVDELGRQLLVRTIHHARVVERQERMHERTDRAARRFDRDYLGLIDVTPFPRVGAALVDGKTRPASAARCAAQPIEPEFSERIAEHFLDERKLLRERIA